MDGIIITGKQGIVKTRFFEHLKAQSLAIDIPPGEDIRCYYHYSIVIIDGIGSVKELPKFIPESFIFRPPYSMDPKEYTKPLIFAITNATRLEFGETMHWLYLDFEIQQEGLRSIISDWLISKKLP